MQAEAVIGARESLTSVHG